MFLLTDWFSFYGKNQISSFLTMPVVKMGHILPKRKNVPPDFYMLYCTWQTIRKLIKSSKNVGGKSTNFCLGPKIWIGHWNPHFTLRSKIHILGSTILKVHLVLAPNRNCVQKSLELIWPILEITSLKALYIQSVAVAWWWLYEMSL